MGHGDSEGACEDGPAVICPCFQEADLAALVKGDGFGPYPPICIGDANEEVAFYVGATACSGDGSTFGCTPSASPETPGCGFYFEDGSGVTMEGLDADQNLLCKSLIFDSCFPPSP